MKKLISSVGRIIATTGVVDVRTLVALAGLASLTRGVAGRWDFDTALIVLGVLLLSAVVWIPTLEIFIAWTRRGSRS